MPVTISAGAFAVSLSSLVVAILSYRSAGPKVAITASKMSKTSGECWLEVRVANSGRSEVDLDGAWAGWLGASLTDLPLRMTAGSSRSLMFRGTLPPAKYLGSSLTIQVGLGNGQTIIKRLRLDEVEIAELERQIDPRDGGPQVTSKTEVAIPLDEV